jgi:LPS-assembly protein
MANYGNLHGVARANYSLPMTKLAGLVSEYNSCCWALRVVVTTTTATNTTTSAFFVQLELKGLMNWQ